MCLLFIVDLTLIWRNPFTCQESFPPPGRLRIVESNQVRNLKICCSRWWICTSRRGGWCFWNRCRYHWHRIDDLLFFFHGLYYLMSGIIQRLRKKYIVLSNRSENCHYPTSSRFAIITDQRSVSLMFSHIQISKIKNGKIRRWRVEPSCYAFDVIHRREKDNTAADAFLEN